MSTLAERCVERGIEWLDEVMPYVNEVPWYENIDLDTLNIQFTDRCVLGQLGGFRTLMDEHDLDDDFCEQYGFDSWTCNTTQNELTEAWIEAIRARRKVYVWKRQRWQRIWRSKPNA